MQRRLSTLRGLTLVELVLTTGILVTGILIVTSLTISSQRLAVLSAQRSEARDALHARLGQIRAMFRDAPPSATQFERVLALDGVTENVALSSHPEDALITIEAFPGALPGTSSEADTNTALNPLGITNIDLDANGSTADGDVPTAQMSVIGVRLQIEWRTADWEPGQPLQMLEIAALLY